MPHLHLIVADAQDLVADGLRYRLADHPAIKVVGHARTGKELLGLLETGPVDLVLLDVALRELDGIDTMRALHKRHPELFVLAHSALTDIEYVNSMLIEGAHGYVVKGGPSGELVEAIGVVMEGGRYISPAARESVATGYAHCEKRPDGEYIGLKPREREVIVMIAKEFTNDEIAAALFISVETVKTHRRNLMAKLNVRSSAGLVKYAHDRCWV